MKRTAIIMTMMVISSALFIAQCIEFLKDHSFWEMVMSPVQFWTGKFGLSALGIGLIANIIVVTTALRAIKKAKSVK